MSDFGSFLTVMASMTAVAATVLAFIFIVPEKKAAKLKGFGKLLHDICNFKFLAIEKIMQALYILTTVGGVLASFVLGFEMFYEEEFALGMLFFCVGPFASFIAVRVVFEIYMLTILLVKNVIQINNKLKNQNDEEKADSFCLEGLKDKYFEKKPAAPAAPAAPVYEAPAAPVYAAPAAPAYEAPAAPAYAAPAAPASRFCAKCGTATVNGQCPNGCQ